MLQFITNSSDPNIVLAQADAVLRGGCRWIQLRMKDAPQDVLRHTLLRLIDMTRAVGATLIVDDHVELAAYDGVAGVHLGAGDMNPRQARRLLGESKIIGYTVNNLETAVRVAELPVDYYGVGPLRHTTTKKRLAPVLGIDGIRQIVSRLKADHPERNIVVIGGVTADDVDAVIDTGADGVAVSGALTGPDAAQSTRKFIKCI